MVRTMAAGLACVFLMVPWAMAQPAPLGPSFPIASGISEVSTLFDIAINDDHFVLVWLDEPQILVQRYAFDGSPIGNQTTVASSQPGIGAPAVALKFNGDFTVQWPTSSGSDLVGRSYNSDGIPLSGDFSIATAINLGLHEDDIHFTRQGRLMSGFVETEPDAGFLRTLQNVKFNPNGSLSVLDSLFTDDSSLYSRLGGDELTGFVHLATRLTSAGSSVDFSAHRLDPDGQPVGQQFVIPSTDAITFLDCTTDLALAPDGSFVITWMNRMLGLPDFEIFVRTMGGDDLPIGDPRPINDLATEGSGSCPSIARGSQGTYLVVWQSDNAAPGGNDDSGSSIVGRQLSPDGVPLNAGFQINDVTSGSQNRPIVRTAPGGNLFLVAWYQQGGTNFQLQARLFAEPMFQDGFESGTTSGWSTANP